MSFIQKIKGQLETRTWLRRTELILFTLLLLASLILCGVGIFRVNRNAGTYSPARIELMTRLDEEDPDYAEDYSEDNTICTVTYRGESG